MNASATAKHKAHLVESLENRICLSSFAPVLAPSNLSATELSASAIKLKWTDNSTNEIGFAIYRSLDQNTWQQVILTGQGATSWTDTNLDPGTTYYYRVQAVALNAVSSWSNTTDATTLASDLFAKLDSNSGHLTVVGTEDDDILSVYVEGEDLKIKLSGLLQVFSKSDVKRISVNGLGGDDRISIGSNVGGVYVSGGAGNDTIFGNDGDDRIDGGAGNDLIKGRDGNDSLFGGDGNDTIYGQAGNDYLSGGNGNDRLIAGDGADRILGNAGNDTIYGEGGLDIILGGGGKDYIVPD